MFKAKAFYKLLRSKFFGPELLRNKIVYMCGSIDACKDLGTGWRKEFQKILRKKFGCNVYNPMEKPINLGIEDAKSRLQRKEWKKSGNYKALKEHVKIIRCVDLRMVDKSDFVIAYLDMDITMCGTIEEISLANRQKKPVIVICKQGVDHIPDWLFAMLPWQLFFPTFFSAQEYLQKVHDGLETNFTDRWIHFDR